MAKINEGTLRDWKDGDKVFADMYEEDREIIRVAVNDNQEQVTTLKTNDTTQDKRLVDLEYNVTGTVVPRTFTELGLQNLTFDDIKLGYIDKKLAESLQDLEIEAGISEELTATEGQTVFTLANSYTPGSSQLRVEVDGVEQTIGNYTETDSKTITLSEALPAGAKVIVTIGGTSPHADTRFSELSSDVAGINTSLSNKASKDDIVLNIKTLGAKGDGTTDDTAIIQSAFNLAKTNGSVKLWFPNGTYKVTATLRIYGNTNVELDNKATILRSHAASILVNGDSTDSFTGYDGNGNITWDGGTFDGNIIAFPYAANHLGLGRGRNLTFRNIIFKDVISDHVFDLNACEDVLIENCRFLGYKDGTSDASRYYAEAIQISNHTQLGFTGFGAWDGTPCRNVTVRDCYFGPSGTEGTGPWGAGVGGHGAVHDLYNSNILIEGCTFDGMTYAGVRNFKYRDLRVVNNLFLSCGYGVAFSNVAANTESSKYGDGTQSGLSQSGDGLVIMGNVFKDTNKSNIYINGQVMTTNISKAKNITIANNQFINQSKAAYDNIYIKWADAVKFVNNIIKGCYRGFNVQYSSNVDIEHNHVEDCLYEGIWVQEDTLEGGGAFLDLGHTKNVNIRFNKVDGTGRNAIIVQHTDDFEITGNKVYNAAVETDNLRDGINCSSSAKNGRVHSNKVRMATTGNQNKYGVDVSGSCTNVQTFNNDAEGKTAKQINASVGGFEGYYMQSPDGTRYKITIANGGVFTATAG